MSTELNEARRRATELRASLKSLEKDLSDVRYCLGNSGNGATPLARRLGVADRGLSDDADNVRALQKLKPALAARIEQTETSIQVAQAQVVELEEAEPTRRAEEVEKAKAALEVLPKFAQAGLMADQALRAFVSANLEMRAAAKEMMVLGHPIANAENLRIAFGRIVDTALSQISSTHVRSPGSASFDLLTASWAENARLRLEAILSAPTSAAQTEEAA